MKKHILIMTTVLLSFSVSFAGKWTDLKFDLSKLYMTINGHVQYTPNGLDLSDATVSIIIPKIEAQYDGKAAQAPIAIQSFEQADGTVIGFDTLICRKIGKTHSRYEEKNMDPFAAVALINQDLTVRNVSMASGTSAYNVIECF